MRILLNAVAATAGGGITYLRNVVPHLAAIPGIELIVLLPRGTKVLRAGNNTEFIEFGDNAGIHARFWREQKQIPSLIERLRIDLLISAGNFALRTCPVPQILLSRNSLYTSSDFYRDLLNRRQLGIWLDAKVRRALAMRSIMWADVSVAPSEAFARELRNCTGRDVKAIHHGFDQENFFAMATPLSAATQGRLDAARDCVCLLCVSHYNYYRNIDTLLRGIAILKEKAPDRAFRLFLTCKLRSEDNPGAYRADQAAALVRSLGIEEEIVELGTVPYDQLPNLYRACNMYVTAAYAESFAHPLVEAMASGLPIIASEIPVHREICAEAAIFFDRFSPEAFANRVIEMLDSQELMKNLAIRARERARDFSWARHAHELMKLADSLLGSARSAVAA